MPPGEQECGMRFLSQLSRPGVAIQGNSNRELFSFLRKVRELTAGLKATKHWHPAVFQLDVVLLFFRSKWMVRTYQQLSKYCPSIAYWMYHWEQVTVLLLLNQAWCTPLVITKWVSWLVETASHVTCRPLSKLLRIRHLR